MYIYVLQSSDNHLLLCSLQSADGNLVSGNRLSDDICSRTRLLQPQDDSMSRPTRLDCKVCFHHVLHYFWSGTRTTLLCSGKHRRVVSEVRLVNEYNSSFRSSRPFFYSTNCLEKNVESLELRCHCHQQGLHPPASKPLPRQLRNGGTYTIQQLGARI